MRLAESGPIGLAEWEFKLYCLTGHVGSGGFALQRERNASMSERVYRLLAKVQATRTWLSLQFGAPGARFGATYLAIDETVCRLRTEPAATALTLATTLRRWSSAPFAASSSQLHSSNSLNAGALNAKESSKIAPEPPKSPKTPRQEIFKRNNKFRRSRLMEEPHCQFASMRDDWRWIGRSLQPDQAEEETQCSTRTPATHFHAPVTASVCARDFERIRKSSMS